TRCRVRPDRPDDGQRGSSVPPGHRQRRQPPRPHRRARGPAEGRAGLRGPRAWRIGGRAEGPRARPQPDAEAAAGRARCAAEAFRPFGHVTGDPPPLHGRHRADPRRNAQRDILSRCQRQSAARPSLRVQRDRAGQPGSNRLWRRRLMGPHKGNPFRAGLVTLAGALIIVLLAMAINVSFGLPFNLSPIPPGQDYSVKAAFTDANGVSRGADVVIAGHSVGQVTGVEVSGTQAMVSMRISSHTPRRTRLPRPAFRTPRRWPRSYTEIRPSITEADLRTAGRLGGV